MGALGYRPRSLRFAPVARLVSGRYSSAVVCRESPEAREGLLGPLWSPGTPRGPPSPLGRELSG